MPQRLLERRNITVEVESRAKGSNIYVEGYAAMFEKRSSNLGGFVEQVMPTAFNKTIKEADVRALWNHDAQYLLGRTSSKTLELSVDGSGLYYRALLPNTSYGRDLAELLERRDVRESSFTFFNIQDNWGLTEEGYPERSLMEVGLIDVAPVTFPAYSDATSGISRSGVLIGEARSAALMGLATKCSIDGCEIESKLDSDEAIRNAIQGLNEPGITEPRNGTQNDDTTQQNSKYTKEQLEAERAKIEAMILQFQDFSS